MFLRNLPLVLLGLLTFGAVSVARGELVLTNFSATNLIKIMPIGDSITDDCIINGAWRAPLQALLETNGLAFTNTGRLLSNLSAGFTKRKHEGYCGAVIAAPGLLTSPVQGYAGPDVYLQKIVADALAITNNRPQLVLLLIGANDIGRGRNPWAVATNDLPKLLSLIFSNVPTANVILAKITTLQNANASGLNYGAYATNVPVFNAALQAMVNQRRALGENVFLADMFSAVDYSTMIMNDHLHPNTAGLKAIAAEWAMRVQTISLRPNQTTSVFINGGAVWKYLDAGQDLGTNWAQPNYDDHTWSSGIARLGYGDRATATTVSFGPDATNKFVTTYFRRAFVVPGNAVITNLNFRLARADGVAVWLNGQEVFRANLPSGPLTYTNLALSMMTGFTAHIFYPTNLTVSNLPPGTNWVAVEIHQSAVTNSNLGFDLELIGSGDLAPPPPLSIAPADQGVRLSWPVTNYGSSFVLYATTNPALAESWTIPLVVAQTNNGQIVVTQSLEPSAKFFRLQRP